MKTKPPKTPELEKMRAVTAKSQVIGEFLDLFLNQEKGIHLCAFKSKGNTGVHPYLWKDGVKKAKKDGAKTSSREPELHDVWNEDAKNNPEYEAWGDHYQPVHVSIEKLLAEYFEIDLNKVEKERRALLEYVRSQAA